MDAKQDMREAADPSTDPGVNTCRNCGTPAPGRYCPECGQETATEVQATGPFLRDLVNRNIGAGGPMAQTLSRLFVVPGALTVDYLAGKRARYLRPLQLYLLASVVVFAVVQMFGLDIGLRFYGDRGFHLVRAAAPPDDGSFIGGARFTPMQIILDHVDTPAIRGFKALSPPERFNVLHAKRLVYVSYFALLLVPLFALIVGLCYRTRRRTYGTHLVFSLHIHSFLLLMMLAAAMLPTILGNVMAWGVVGYVLVALRHVYGGTWAETLGRGSAVLSLYFVAGFVANLLLVILLLAF
jgi:ribosomal protein L32